MNEPKENAERPARTWAVHRQDDNGNCFVVATGLSQEEAEWLAAEYQNRGHKQLYWAEIEQ
jgi:hypothetical protein